MSLMLMAGMAAVGAYQAYQANEQRKADASEQEILLKRQRRMQNEQQKLFYQNRDASRSILNLQANAQGIQTTASSRTNARQAAVADGQTQAALGVSGTTGGTAFYNLASQIDQNRVTLNEQNKLGDMGMQEMVFGGIKQGLGFQSQQLEIDNNMATLDSQMSKVNEQQSYLNSPAATIMALATGSMAGASTGADLTALGEKAFGVPEKMDGIVAKGPDAAPLISEPHSLGFGPINQYTPISDPHSLGFGPINHPTTLTLPSYNPNKLQSNPYTKTYPPTRNYLYGWR